MELIHDDGVNSRYCSFLLHRAKAPLMPWNSRSVRNKENDVVSI
jgi:hypothetical protein